MTQMNADGRRRGALPSRQRSGVRQSCAAFGAGPAFARPTDYSGAGPLGFHHAWRAKAHEDSFPGSDLLSLRKSDEPPQSDTGFQPVLRFRVIATHRLEARATLGNTPIPHAKSFHRVRLSRSEAGACQLHVNQQEAGASGKVRSQAGAWERGVHSSRTPSVWRTQGRST